MELTTILEGYGFVEDLDHAADREAGGTREGPPVDDSRVHRRRRRRADERGEPGEEEQDRADLVDRDDPPVELVGVQPDVAASDLELREVPRDQEADAPEDVGKPDPAVRLAWG